MRFQKIVEARIVCLASCLHRLVKTVFEMLLTQGLHMSGIQRTTYGIVMSFEAVITNVRKSCIHDAPLFFHFCLVLVHPGVSLDREIQILGCAWVRPAQIVWGVVMACEGCEIAALQWDNLRFGVIGHFDIEDKRKFAAYFGCLPHDHQTISFESATLDAEAPSRIHLPEETNLPVLLRQHPDSEQIAARHQRLVEVMARLPGALGTSILGN